MRKQNTANDGPAQNVPVIVLGDLWPWPTFAWMSVQLNVGEKWMAGVSRLSSSSVPLSSVNKPGWFVVSKTHLNICTSGKNEGMCEI